MSLFKKEQYKRIAVALSLCTLIIWCVLGTGVSLAWFTDTSPKTNNIFHFADFKLVVSHRLTNGKWEEVDSRTKIFSEDAIYEPGYTQVAYLKVENKGDRPFKFYTAVNVTGFSTATNVFGQPFLLQDHLRFGIVTADSEDAIQNRLSGRDAAVQIATGPLHNYCDDEAFELAPNGMKYIALIVQMPKETGNISNYRGNTIPRVDLGITVKAEQIKD